MSDPATLPDIGTAVRQYLLTRDRVSEVVGTRIYTDVLPKEATLPCIVYFVVTGRSEEHLLGASGMAHTTIQFDCYATTRAAANNLAERMRTAPLVGLRGRIGTPSIFVYGINLSGPARYSPDTPTDGSDEYRYLNSQDFLFSHSQVIS